MRLPRRYRKLFSRIAIIAILAFGINYYQTHYANTIAQNDIPQTLSHPNQSVAWWSEYYIQRIQITKIQNGINSFKINHSQLIIDQLVDRQGNEFAIIKKTKEKNEKINIQISNPDSIETQIYFQVDDTNATYYLYFDTTKISESEDESSEMTNYTETQDANLAELLETEKLTASIKTKNNWILLEEAKELKLDINISAENFAGEAYYILDNSLTAQKIMQINQNDASIPLKGLSIGQHEFYIVLQTSEGKIKSNTIEFIITKPIYVAWTVNWAGIDVPQGNLNDIENISREYAIPMTQFFNPRVLVSNAIPEYRKAELSNWILERYKAGDEISMQMHMQHDMVELTGVRAKDTQEGWYGDYRGYDLPITEYSEQEIFQILDWGKRKFIDWGLPEPQGFRAGGWFADEESLRATERIGFKYDSTARQKIKLGETDYIQKWEIESTKQPYFPSYSNINKTSQSPMDLKEFPINGGDTFNMDTDTLITNFYDNFDPNKIQSEEKIITFATYPEWFEIDKPKLIELFNEISKHSNSRNKGPVVFVTLDELL